jgi:hypothetical protein
MCRTVFRERNLLWDMNLDSESSLQWFIMMYLKEKDIQCYLTLSIAINKLENIYSLILYYDRTSNVECR